MYHRFQEKFGTAGMVVAVIALIAALAGTAIAASGLTAKEKKEVKKIAKSFQGTGPTGSAGPAGPAGANGKDGAPGAPGAPGKDGVSVTSSELLPGDENCPDGGSEFTAAEESVSYACNGETGFTATLPPGETETGVWTMNEASGSSPGFALGDISFPIPLSEELDEEHVKLIPAGGPVDAVCDDNEGAAASVDNPEADPGYLCVFTGFATGEVGSIVKPNESPGTVGALKTGAIVQRIIPEGILAAWGTFAVTAKE